MLVQPSISKQRLTEKTGISHSVMTDTDKKAAILFKTVTERIFTGSNWPVYLEIEPSTFVHSDEQGEPVEQLLKQGDHFRIGISSSNDTSTPDYNWIYIEKIEKHVNPCAEWEAIAITLKPVQHPAGSDHPGNEKDTASTLLLQREKRKLIAEVYAREETHEAAINCFSKTQWEHLVKAVLSPR